MELRYKAETWDPRISALVEAVRVTVNRSSKIRQQLVQAESEGDVELLLSAFIRLSRLEKGLQQRIRQAYRDVLAETKQVDGVER